MLQAQSPSTEVSIARSAEFGYYSSGENAPTFSCTDFCADARPADWERSREVQGTRLPGMPRDLQRCSFIRSCSCDGSTPSDLQLAQVRHADLHFFQVHLYEVVFYPASFGGGEKFLPVQGTLP